MQHNCAISIIYHEKFPVFKLYLSSYGTPEQVRTLLLYAVRGGRGILKSDPEPFLSLLTYQAVRRCKKVSTVTYHPRDANYLWRYRIDLLRMIPTIKISNFSNGLSDTHLLFEFLGPASTRHPKQTREEKVPEINKRGRGRPSNLSRGLKEYAVPAPKEVLPDGTVVFGDARDKVKNG